MANSSFTESIVEDAALGWLESLGYAVQNGQVIAPGEPAAERDDYGQVVLAQRLRQALTRLNPTLPAEALDDAFRKLIRTDAPALLAHNHAPHRMLVNGVTVEYRWPDGPIAGAQARLLDFDQPQNNDWLAVNQFAVVENTNKRRPDVVVFINGLPEALFAPHESLPWNPLVARTLFRRGVIESWGRGTIKMAELMQQAGLPRPEIEDTGGCVTVRLRPSRYVPPQRVGRDVTERQQAILTLLAGARAGLALRDIHARLGRDVTERQVREDLATLRILGLALPSGHGRGARWKRL